MNTSYRIRYKILKKTRLSEPYALMFMAILRIIYELVEFNTGVSPAIPGKQVCPVT